MSISPRDDASSRASKPRRLSPNASLIVLGAMVLAAGVFFFHVIQPFVFPLMLAGMLALLFYPLYERVLVWCRYHRRIAAAAATAIILLAAILPIGAALFYAGQEMVGLGRDLVEERFFDPQLNPHLAAAVEWLDQFVPLEDRQDLREAGIGALNEVIQEVYNRTRSILANVVGFIIGLVVTVLALYYFFAEGPELWAKLRRVSLMEAKDEDALFRKFDQVCRGVVLGTVVSALAQAVLAGIGFAVAGVDRAWLLAGCTMLAALIPFLGAAAVWIPVAGWLFFTGRPLAAFLLTVYGAGIVSTCDNFIRAHVVHRHAQLHPLIVFITVIGAIQVVGLWGIFAGPIIAAFFYSLLKLLHDRLSEQVTLESPSSPPVK